MKRYSLVHKVAHSYLQANQLGKLLPMPLREWMERMYNHVKLIDDFNDFYFWLQDFRKVREIQRRSGVDYDIGNHWSQALEDNPMLNFEAADDEVKDWREIFYSIDKSPQEYREFWRWAGNTFQVRLWIANVFRSFWNYIWAEHQQLLEDQLQPAEPQNDPSKKVDEEKAAPESWEQEEAEASEEG